MKPHIIAGLKQILKNRISELKFLHISWFGGEPLLAADIVQEISNYVQSHLKKEDSRLIYTGSMTTNGYLLNIDMIKLLIDCGVQDFQISLDGDEDIHDKSRRLADHRGTFKTIWKNISDFHDSTLQAKILLRIHFSPDTYQYLPAFLKKIDFCFGGDSRFKIGFKSIERLGGVNDKEVMIFKSNDEKMQVIEWLCGYVNPEMILHANDDYICYAARANSLVIRANGDIGKCTVALNDERNKIGRLNEDGTVDINNQNFRLWLTGLEKKDKRILSCPYNYMNNNN